MTNSTAPIFMETIDKLGAGHLFGLDSDREPSSAGSLSLGSPSTGSSIAGSLTTGSTSTGFSSTGSMSTVPAPAGTADAESRAETTERLRLVAARSGEPADLRDYLTALATAVPAMSADNCRLVAGLLGVGVAPAFRESGPLRQP
jgi:hypothetical protein